MVNKVQSQTGRIYSGNDVVKGPITALAVSVASTDSQKILDAHDGEGSPCLRTALYGVV